MKGDTASGLLTAVLDMEEAYRDVAGRPEGTLGLLTGLLVEGTVLPPGVYTWTTVIQISGNIILRGGPFDTWIFRTTGDVIVWPGKRMKLEGGAAARNIVWQVAGYIRAEPASHLEGTFLVKTACVFQAGATLNGRLYAGTAVTLIQNTITPPAALSWT